VWFLDCNRAGDRACRPFGQASSDMTSRRNQAIKLRKKTGLSCAEIGRRLGISRQRAWQLAAPKKLPSDVILTHRERQILALIAQGYTTKEIAAALSIRPHTVNNQIYHMMKKLGLKNRTQLVLAFHTRL